MPWFYNKLFHDFIYFCLLPLSFKEIMGKKIVTGLNCDCDKTVLLRVFWNEFGGMSFKVLHLLKIVHKET